MTLEYVSKDVYDPVALITSLGALTYAQYQYFFKNQIMLSMNIYSGDLLIHSLTDRFMLSG